MPPNEPYELIEVIIHSDEQMRLPTDEERMETWGKINKVNCECSQCVWGIKDMEAGIPIYCECFYGRQHVFGQPPPWYIRWAESFIEAARRFLKN